MRVLLSTIGSRGEVQPMVGLASELRALGQEVRLCVPPDFTDWVGGLGFDVVPIGPEVRQTAKAGGQRVAEFTLEQRLALIQGTVATQFERIGAAVKDCDAIVGGGALMVGARSVAERSGIPYVYASFCPVTLPSPHHAPPSMGLPTDETADDRAKWADDARRWNELWGGALNSHRAAAGLAPVTDVRGHLFTDRPWLAADPVLGPWPGSADPTVFQTGAWIYPDERPLSAELEAFLAAGEPPVYFGFGSMRASEDLGRAMIASARAHGRRAIVARGWADLAPVDDEPDWLSVGEVNQRELFTRVAAVVHHGGAGTTATAGRAGAPQVLVPQMYDQPYWARRVADLGIGAAHAPSVPTEDTLATALGQVLRPEVVARAGAVAAEVRVDGARIAAQRLIAGG
ncbi:glycosyltransferase family 1 protein [Solihabitans fulvus]|uniref:Glycosyltransferase family 1 protein n=1 Tax=Solihabitans fulvus TaxID=1892852 RepID=A0A5B2XEW9_9PSEU|nr:glycosyltransferase [Solihabitans fulvus]KAA2261664.1 glycosyltransferase family 1 protein [Solihabitans fulvus]